MLYRKVDKSSADSIPIGLNYFNMPDTEVAVERSYERELLSLNPLSQTPFQYKLHTGSAFCDGTKSRVYVQMRFLKKAKTDPDLPEKWVGVEASDEVGIVNGIGACWIKNIVVRCDGQTVSTSDGLYHYRATFENDLFYSEEAKKSSMNVFGYYYEQAPKSKPADYIKDTAFLERKELFLDGKTVEFSSPLYVDLFQQPGYLLSHMNFEIDIHTLTEQQMQWMIYCPKTKTKTVGNKTVPIGADDTRKFWLLSLSRV